MTPNLKEEITNLTNKIVEVAPAHKIYLFGSIAYGEPNSDSDIDLCIITDNENVRKRDLVKSIRKSIATVATMPIDIFVYYKDEFSKRAQLKSTLEYNIANEGISLYEQ